MPNCESCKDRRKQAEPVPYIAHQAAMARWERTVKKLWITTIILSILLAASVTFIIWRITQYETQVSEIEVDTGEGDAYVAGIGDVTIGESKGQNTDNNP